MTKRRAIRRGLTPVERPTEWITAVAMLLAAVAAFRTDHDVAGFLAVVAACLPVITTAITTAWETRNATTTTEPVDVVE